MNRLFQVFAPAALVAGLAASAVGLAQPPREGQPPGEKAARRPGEKAPERPPAEPRRGDPAGRPPAKLDPAAEAWVKTLIEKMTDPHDVIRDSARAGIVAAGREAVPLLVPIAEGSDGAKAVAARRLIERIQSGDRGPVAAARGADGRQPDPNNPRGRPDAPPGERPNADGPPLLERILGQLDLTEKQQKELRELRDSVQQKFRGLGEQFRDGKIDRQEMPDRVRKVNEEAMAEVKEILTQAQLKKLAELAPEGRPLFGPPPGRPGNPGERRPDSPPPGERPRPERPKE